MSRPPPADNLSISDASESPCFPRRERLICYDRARCPPSLRLRSTHRSPPFSITFHVSDNTERASWPRLLRPSPVIKNRPKLLSYIFLLICPCFMKIVR